MLLWKLKSHLFDRIALRKADADDQVEVALGKCAKRGFEGIVVGGFDVFDEGAQPGFRAHCAFIGGGVEGFVVFAAAIEDESDFKIGTRGGESSEQNGA